MAQKFYIVIQDPNRPLLRETVVYVNTRGGTDLKTGEYLAPVCRGLDPDGMGIYAFDTEGEYGKEKTMALERARRNAASRLLGPFNTREEAIMAEMRERPKTTEQQLALERAENEKLRSELAALSHGRGSGKTKQD